MLARWTVAFSLATMAHLREESHLEQDLQARDRVLARVQRCRRTWPLWCTRAEESHPEQDLQTRALRQQGFRKSQQPGRYGAPARGAPTGAGPAGVRGVLARVQRCRRAWPLWCTCAEESHPEQDLQARALPCAKGQVFTSPAEGVARRSHA